MRRQQYVTAIATSFTGNNLVKYRILVNGKITRSQAESLANNFFTDLASSLPNNQNGPATLLKPFVISFQIVDSID